MSKKYPLTEKFVTAVVSELSTWDILGLFVLVLLLSPILIPLNLIELIQMKLEKRYGGYPTTIR